MAAIAFFGFFRASDAYPVGHLNPEPYAPFAFWIALVIVTVQWTSGTSTLGAARALPERERSDAFPLTRVATELRSAFAQRSFHWFALGGVIAARALGGRQVCFPKTNRSRFCCRLSHSFRCWRRWAGPGPSSLKGPWQLISRTRARSRLGFARKTSLIEIAQEHEPRFALFLSLLLRR
jgi:hypothetical protein